jgi:acetoacetyl-CoA synthetase
MPAIGDLFKPIDPDVAKRSQMERFRQFINARYSLDIKGTWELHAWSVDHSNEFWKSIWDFYGFIGEKGAEPVRNLSVSSPCELYSTFSDYLWGIRE